MPKTQSFGLSDFVGRLAQAVSRGRSEHDTVAAVKDVVTEALESPGWVPERCLRTSDDCYARHLLFKDPNDRFAVVVMVWGKGQKTLVHDHGGVWCVEGVYQGRIRVTRYDQEGPVVGNVAHFQPREVIEAGKGETGALIPPVEHHSIENIHELTAVTVHTYGCDLRTCHVYVPRPDGAYDVCIKPLAYVSVPETQPGEIISPR